MHEDIVTLLREFKGAFENPKGLPPPRAHYHKIVLNEGTQPISTRPYRYPYYQKAKIEKIVIDLLKTRVIRPSINHFSSLVLLVRKADQSWCLCIDYWALNQEIVKDKFLIPLIDELLDELYGLKIFSKPDSYSDYHQIRVMPEDIEKIAFRTHDRYYQFFIMPFGLTHIPYAFQWLMNELFRFFLRKIVLI